MKYIIKYSIGGSNSQPIVFDHISQFNDITDDNIQQAVTLWLENKSKAITQYGHISDWDTSKVTNMNNLIDNRFFDEDLSRWDTSIVTNMSDMFRDAMAFKSELNTHVVTKDDGTRYIAWDTSKVVNMENMFNSATSFTSDLSSWNTSNVTNMSGMFRDALSFTSDLSSWNTSKVYNMRNMFDAARSFTSDLNTRVVTKDDGTRYTAWDTINVTDMSGMFMDTIPAMEKPEWYEDDEYDESVEDDESDKDESN